MEEAVVSVGDVALASFLMLDRAMTGMDTSLRVLRRGAETAMVSSISLSMSDVFGMTGKLFRLVAEFDFLIDSGRECSPPVAV